jgi:DNA-binding phage protein
MQESGHVTPRDGLQFSPMRVIILAMENPTVDSPQVVRGFVGSVGLGASISTPLALPSIPSPLPPCACASSYQDGICSYHDPRHPDNLGIVEECALALAQCVVQRAIIQSGLSKAEIARRLGVHHSTITKSLKGEHNLTVKTMARVLWACGVRMRIEIDTDTDSLTTNHE